MALVRRPDPNHAAARQASREIILWTTKDGREIPLDEMSDDHIANAIRVLSLWRSRLKKRGSSDPIASELAAAVTRFKLIQRQRRKAARETPREKKPKPQPRVQPWQPSSPQPARQSSSPPRSRLSARPRKPVAST